MTLVPTQSRSWTFPWNDAAPRLGTPVRSGPALDRDLANLASKVVRFDLGNLGEPHDDVAGEQTGRNAHRGIRAGGVENGDPAQSLERTRLVRTRRRRVHRDVGGAAGQLDAQRAQLT